MSHTTPASLSASQPVIGSSRVNRSKASGSASSSSSPARLLSNTTTGAQEASLSRTSRGQRLRSSSDLQPIMPVPTATVSPPASLVPRPILPDNSTLLAQLLTGSNQAVASTTLVLTADSPSSRYSTPLLYMYPLIVFNYFLSCRIPILFPIQNADTVPTKLDKSLTLMSTTVNLDYANDGRTYKQEPSSNSTVAEEPVTNQNTSRSRSSDGEKTQYRVGFL